MLIIVKNNDPLKAFKLLNRRLHEANVFTDIKEREYYKSKGEKKREKRKKAIARCRKDKALRELALSRVENQITRGNNDKRRNKPTSRG